MVVTSGKPPLPAGKSSKKPSLSAAAAAASDTIVIKVCDEARKVNRDFSCSRALLLSEMSYFKAYLTGSESYDDIDISVHCDVHIFQWLMEHIQRPDSPPTLDPSSVISILISSDFLEMRRLVSKCLLYVRDNISEIVKMPIDLNCKCGGYALVLAAPWTLCMRPQCASKQLEERGHEAKHGSLFSWRRVRRN